MTVPAPETSSSLTSGIALDDLDPGIRPQDDLYRHVNGKWIERTAIPEDKARYGSFLVLAEEAEQAVREILEEARGAEPGTEERKFGDLYSSFLDEQRVQELGAEPIRPLLAQVEGATGVPEFLGVLARLERGGTSGIFQLFVDNDPGNPERYLVFFEQAGLGLPDESYYREEKFESVRAEYRSFLEKMFTLAGVDAAAERAERVFTLETELASNHWDNVRSRDSSAPNTLHAWQGVVEASGLPLEVWRESLGAPDDAFDELVVRQPSFVESLGKV